MGQWTSSRPVQNRASSSTLQSDQSTDSGASSDISIAAAVRIVERQTAALGYQRLQRRRYYELLREELFRRSNTTTDDSPATNVGENQPGLRLMLSDHSEDEDDVRIRRPPPPPRRRHNEVQVYVPPPNARAHDSYQELWQDISSNAGLYLDCQPSVATGNADGTTMLHTAEDAAFQPSCASLQRVIKFAKLGLGTPLDACGHRWLSPVKMRSAVDRSLIVAHANRRTPNKRKIVASLRTKVFCVEYIDNGDTLMTACQDGKLRFYSRHDGRGKYIEDRVIEVPSSKWSILDVTITPDSRYLAYSTWNNVFYHCNLGSPIPEWEPMSLETNDVRFAIFALRCNKSNADIIAGTTSGIYVYDRLKSKTIANVFDAHEDDVNTVAYLDDNDPDLILSSGDDGLVKLWDKRTMRTDSSPVAVFAGHRDGVTFIDSRQDGRYFLTNSKDQSIKVWDVRLQSDQATIEATKKAVSGQSWDYRWQIIPVPVKSTNLAGDYSVMTLRGHAVMNTLIRARFSPHHTGQRFIYTGCSRGGCYVYDLYSGKLHKHYSGHLSVVRDCAWHPVRNEIITSSWDGKIMAWRYDHRGPTQSELDDSSQVVQDWDSTDEFEEQRGSTRSNGTFQSASSPHSGWYDPTAYRGNVVLPEFTDTRLRIKYAEEEQTASESENESSSSESVTYADVTRKHRPRQPPVIR